MQWQSMHVDEFYPIWLQARERGETLHLVDVRTPEEYARAHVPGAQLLPLASLPAQCDRIPDGDTVYIICHSGGRSAQACAFLAQRQSCARLINIEGGTSAWAQAGFPLERGGV